MLARVATFAIDGLEPRRVWVEVDIRQGLPSFTVVGLADAAVREARERVRAAVLNSGFEFPQKRITANLAPAHMRKVGPGFDLALAVGVLAASGQVEVERLASFAVFGELSLSGELRDCRGALAVAEGARRARIDGLIVPRGRAPEAALVEGIAVAGAHTLRAVADVLAGAQPCPVDEPSPRRSAPPAAALDEPDLRDVRGHKHAIEALAIAAAGGHNVLLEGPPGTGKTMLARRVPSILPPLTAAEAIETTRIHSIAGLHDGDGLVPRRPFRAPHHTISAAGLVGGGTVPTPGEATLAHHGVLFLDELSEFARPSLEALRQPLEDGRVTIVRAQHAVVFPTLFMLIAATNPCPCGWAGTTPDRCRCTERDIARHRRRLSGPLLDRVDLLLSVQRPESGELGAPAHSTSSAVREVVMAARELQGRRLAGTGVACNAQMDARLVRAHIRLSDDAQRVLLRAYAGGQLSVRGHARALRVARTVADLAGSDRVEAEHMRRTLTLRGHGEPAEVAA